MIDNLDEEVPGEEEEQTEQKTQNTPFTDILESSGAIDLIADTLVNMYANPKTAPEVFNFFLNSIGAAEHPDIEKILTENQELRKNISALKTQISELEARVRK